MVPKLIRGTSFKGAAAYLLHDVGTPSSDRIAWAETRNLASPNPDTAWRVMVATAMDADRLKALAGIKATGRKSAHSVLHLVLSWHPEEAEALDREQMLAAAEGALKSIGAMEHQALIIAHNDSAHPHIHILVNRVSPRDGRMLASSKEKLKLSQWAQAYEEQRGKIYCEDRVLNNEARARGDYTRAAKGIPWQVIKAEAVIRKAANDNITAAAHLREELRLRMQKIGQAMRDTLSRHRQEWEAFERAHIARQAAVASRFNRLKAQARGRIIGEFRPLWRDNRQRESQDLARFDTDEQTRLGRMRSVFRMIGNWRSSLDGQRPQAVSQIWSGLFSSEHRRTLLMAEHQHRRDALESQQRRAIRQAVLGLYAEHRLSLRTNAEAYQAERSSLVLAHRADLAKTSAEWSQLRKDRDRIAADVQASYERKQTFTRAATGQSYLDRLTGMAKAHRERKPEQDNARNRDQERE